MRHNNTTRFTPQEVDELRTLAQKFSLRRLALRKGCSTTKILSALGRWTYQGQRQEQQKAVSQ